MLCLEQNHLVVGCQISGEMSKIDVAWEISIQNLFGDFVGKV